MKQSALLLVAALCTAAFVQPAMSAPMEKSHIPAHAQWVVHLDVEAFFAGQLGRWVAAEIVPQFDRKLESIKQLLGVDVSSDIDALTLFGPDAAEENAVALIYGTFDRDKLLGVLAQNEVYTQTTYGDAALHHWRDDFHGKNQVGAFAADNVIVISQTVSGVTGVLDVLAGRPALADDAAAPLRALTEGTQGAFLVAAADEVAALAQGRPHATILKNSRLLTVIADEKDDDARLFVLLEADSPEAAAQVEQMANGMLAFAMLRHKDNPDLLALILACRLERKDAQITFDFSYPVEGLMKLLPSYHLLKKGL